MASYNHVALMGNLTRDPEVRYTPSGMAIASLTLAVNRTWKDQSGEKKEEVSFIDCTAFGRTAEVAGEYLHKGQAVLVGGRLKQETWEDKNGGGKRSAVKVIVESLVMVGQGKQGGSGGGNGGLSSQPAGKQTASSANAGASEPAPDDDVPF